MMSITWKVCSPFMVQVLWSTLSAANCVTASEQVISMSSWHWTTHCLNLVTQKPKQCNKFITSETPRPNSNGAVNQFDNWLVNYQRHTWIVVCSVEFKIARSLYTSTFKFLNSILLPGVMICGMQSFQNFTNMHWLSSPTMISRQRHDVPSCTGETYNNVAMYKLITILQYHYDNRHVTNDVTWPWKVKVVTPMCLGPSISEMAGDKAW